MKALKEYLDTFLKPLIQRGYQSQLVKDGFGSILINFINKGLNIISGMILVRTLGVDEYGVYSFVFAAVVLLYITAEFGVPNLLIRETAKGVAEEKPGLTKGVWFWGLKTTLLITGGLIAISALLLLIFFQSGRLTAIEFQTFLVGLAVVPLYVFIHLFKGAMQGLNKIILALISELVVLPVSFILFVLVTANFTSFAVNPITIMIIRFLVCALAGGLSTIFFFQFIPKNFNNIIPLKDSRNWIASSVNLALSNGLSIIKSKSSTLILGFIGTSFQVGIYEIASHGSMIASIFLIATNMVLAPRFSNLFFAGKIKKLQHLTTLHSRFVLALNMLITLFFVAFGKFALRLVFGAESDDAYIPLLIMLIGQIVNSSVGGVGYLLNMTGYEKFAMQSSAVGLALSLLLNLLLIPKTGMIGTAIATSISLAVSQILMWRIVLKKIGINSFALHKLV